jgi:hypothetical protein
MVHVASYLASQLVSYVITGENIGDESKKNLF